MNVVAPYSRVPRSYLPHLDGENLRMGLSPISPQAWLQVDADWPHFHAHKIALGVEKCEMVFAQLPTARSAIAELAPMVHAHLLNDHADQFRALGEGGLIHDPSDTALCRATGENALWTISTWVQEDILILQASAGQYRLTAGSLCLPSRWSLREKLGQPMCVIHEPVPELNDRLGERIDRFFNHLRVDKPVERFNWSLQGDAALAEFLAPDEPIEHLHYRVERQTLRRLPDTGAIVFTVRIYVAPFEKVAVVPGALTQLRADIATMPKAFSEYKRMPHFQAALHNYTDPSNPGD